MGVINLFGMIITTIWVALCQKALHRSLRVTEMTANIYSSRGPTQYNNISTYH